MVGGAGKHRVAEQMLPARQRQSAGDLLLQRILLGSIQRSQGQRRLPLSEHLGAGETCQRFAARDGVLPRRRQPSRQQFRGRVQHGQAGRQGHHRRLGGLPTEHHGLSRAAWNEGRWRRKFCGAGRGGSAEVGEQEHRRLRRRPRQGDDCGPVGRIAQCQNRAFDAAGQGPVPARDHAQQPHRHGAAGKAELRDARGQDGRGRSGVREIFPRQDAGRFAETPGGRVLQGSGQDRRHVSRDQQHVCGHRRSRC